MEEALFILALAVGIFLLFQLQDVLKNRNNTKVLVEQEKTKQTQEATKQEEFRTERARLEHPQSVGHETGTASVS